MKQISCKQRKGPKEMLLARNFSTVWNEQRLVVQESRGGKYTRPLHQWSPKAFLALQNEKRFHISFRLKLPSDYLLSINIQLTASQPRSHVTDSDL